MVSLLDDKLKGSLCGFIGSLMLRDHATLVAFTEYNRNVIRLEPPLIAREEHIDAFLKAFDASARTRRRQDRLALREGRDRLSVAPALSDAALTRRQSYSRRPLWLALGIVAAVFLAAALHVTLQRGTWMDEFWTLWFSQHDIGLAELVRARWVADYNPPLFSFWHWLFTPLVGSVPLPHRLMNVLAVAWAAYFLVGAARRYPASANVLMVHALLVLSLPAVVPYFAELRSYFSQIWIFHVLLGTLIVANDRASDLDWQQDRWLAVMLSLSVLMALNIHYVSTTLAGPLIGAAVVLFWWRGQRRLALTLVAASALAAVPLFSFYFMHRDYLSDEMQTFWIRGGVVEGLQDAVALGKGGGAGQPAGRSDRRDGSACVDGSAIAGRLRCFAGAGRLLAVERHPHPVRAAPWPDGHARACAAGLWRCDAGAAGSPPAADRALPVQLPGHRRRIDWP